MVLRENQRLQKGFSENAYLKNRQGNQDQTHNNIIADPPVDNPTRGQRKQGQYQHPKQQRILKVNRSTVTLQTSDN